MWPIVLVGGATTIILVSCVWYANLVREYEYEYKRALWRAQHRKRILQLHGEMYANATVLGQGAYGVVVEHHLFDVGRVARKLFTSRSAFADEARWNTHIRVAINRAQDAEVAAKASYLAIALGGGGGIANQQHYLDFPLALCDLSAMTRNESEHGCCAALNTPDKVRLVVEHTLKGLDFLHENARILHNDIKPANMLMYADGRVCLADFGMALHIPLHGAELDTSRIGTITYQAPEVYLNDLSPATKPDIFSLGASLYHVFDGVLLVSLDLRLANLYSAWQDAAGHNNQLIAKTIFTSAIREWFEQPENSVNFCRLCFGRNLKHYGYMPDNVAALLRTMIALDPVKRPTAAEALMYLKHATTANEWLTAHRATAQLGHHVALSNSAPDESTAVPQTVVPQTQASAVEEPSQCVLRVLDQYHIPNDVVRTARFLVKHASSLWKMTRGRGTTTLFNAAKLKQSLSDRAHTNPQHRAAFELLEGLHDGGNSQDAGTSSSSTRSGSSDSGDRAQLSELELLIFAALLDERITFMAGGVDPNRLIFEAITCRGNNWWKKRAAALRKNYVAHK